MKIPNSILITIGVILLLLLIVWSRQTCYALPTNPDPAKFGPKYWKAFHDLAHRVPCPACRMEAESFIKFFHDYVNQKLAKPLYDKENYNNWVTEICKLKTT